MAYSLGHGSFGMRPKGMSSIAFEDCSHRSGSHPGSANMGVDTNTCLTRRGLAQTESDYITVVHWEFDVSCSTDFSLTSSDSELLTQASPTACVSYQDNSARIAYRCIGGVDLRLCWRRLF